MLLNREDPLTTGVSNGKRFILFLYCLRLVRPAGSPWKRYKLSVKIRIFACANTAYRFTFMIFTRIIDSSVNHRGDSIP